MVRLYCICREYVRFYCILFGLQAGIAAYLRNYLSQFRQSSSIGALNIKDTVSVDQLLAHHLGNETHYASYVFGSDGGIRVVGT